MLIEGLDGGKHPQPWKDFSSAMVRHAIGEAMNSLPSEHRQVVKLAYFGGFTNREIADHLGLTVGGVRRRLRQALAGVSEYVERGRAFGRRAAYALLVWFAGRSIAGTGQRPSGAAGEQFLKVAAVMVAGATAAAVIASHPASPAQLTQVDRGGGAPAAAPIPPGAVQQSEAPAVVEGALPVSTAVDQASAPVTAVTSKLPPVPVKVRVPPLPAVPPLPSPPLPPLPKISR